MALVRPAPLFAQTLNVRVAADNDDAEERESGSMYLDSSDLEMVFDGGGQKVGLRFQNVTVPAGASISNAYIQFQVDETSSGTTQLTIHGQAIANAPAFTSSADNISNRSPTAASVPWNPTSWTSSGAAGTAQRTENIASVIEEIVGGNGWQSGNALVIVITGSGERVAESHEGDSSGAALLHIEYTEGGGGSTTTTSTTPGPTTTSTTLEPPPPGAGSATSPELTVMYIGDGPQDDAAAAAIYGLAIDRGVEAIVHAGDLDYNDDPAAFWGRVHDTLGTTFPYFISVGNHDDQSWSQYGGEGQAQCDRNPDATCVGDYGVNSTVFYKGLTIVLSGIGTLGSDHEAYLRQELAASDSIWKNCSWHKQQEEFQLGDKGNSTDWGVYQACQDHGAFVANGHEHTYGRTKTLVDMAGLTVDPTAPERDLLFVGPGRTFVACSGLAGASIRNQLRCVGPNGPCTIEGDQCVFSTGAGCNDIWAAFYGAHLHGGLIITYHVDGNPWKARGQFVSVDGVVRDEFTIFSENSPGLPTTTSSTTTSTSTTSTSTTSTTTSTTSTPTAAPTTTTAAPTTTTTTPLQITSLSIQVASGADDAEESGSGSVNVSSSDLELSYDGNPQVIGIRFVGVDIPKDASIITAYVQFQVDETRPPSNPADLTIWGQATGDAAPFTTASGNISSRARTPTSRPWSPQEWDTVGAAGTPQRTAEIAPIIQDIVSHDDWAAGHALALIITGNTASKDDSRIAESYNGSTSGAPVLHVAYGVGAPPTTSTLPATTTTSSTAPAPTTTTAPTATTSTTLPPGEATLFSDTFTAGLGQWTETGEGDWNTESLHTSSGYPGSGSGSPAAHSDNCDTGCTLTQTTPINLTGYQSAMLTLLRFVDVRVDAAEFLRVQAWNGSTWVLLDEWTGSNGGDDNTWHSEAYDLGAFLGQSDFQLRLVTQQTSTSEHVHIDDVVVIGTP
jgi:hypothetical protein